MNLVNLELAVKAYGEHPLLDQVSLGVSAGDRIGVVGRNGAGKSTLLTALAGAGDLDAGRFTGDSVDAAREGRAPPRRRNRGLPDRTA